MIACTAMAVSIDGGAVETSHVCEEWQRGVVRCGSTILCGIAQRWCAAGGCLTFMESATKMLLAVLVKVVLLSVNPCRTLRTRCNICVDPGL